MAADSRGASRGARGGSDGAALRAAAQAGAGCGSERDVRAAELRLGRGGPGGLVRSHGGVRGGPPDHAFFQHAQHGGRRGVSRGVFPRHAASVFGSARTGFSLFRRSVPAAALRQPEECGEKDFARVPARRDRPADRFSFALGIPDGVLQPGARQREGRGGRRSGLFPEEPSGAGAESKRSGGVERVFAHVLPAGGTAADSREVALGGRSDSHRERASAAFTQRRVRAGGDEFPGGGWPRLRESANESLLRAIAGGNQDAGTAAACVRGSVARTTLRGAARTQFRAASGGAGSGALSGRAGEKAGRAGGIDTVAAVARTRALAGEFRPAVAELAREARKAGRYARDDRVAAPGPATRLGSVAERDRASVGAGLHGRGGGAPSAGGRHADPRRATASRGRLAGTLRAAAARAERLRPVARSGAAMNQQAQALEHASVRQFCKAVKVPVVGANFVQLAEQAVKENRSHIGYLEALLAMESEERDRHAIAHRLHEAKLPRMKTLEEFEFARAPQIPAAKVRELAERGYITRAEPVVLIGECGTGKTHLATGLCVAAFRQKKRVRFTTAANLVNELVEAKQHNGVKRVLTRWLRYDVIALDEVGYVPLAEIGAEFLFQVIAERAERAAVIVTTNLPFSEWTQVFPNPRLCKALLDRITDRAHIIETGTESYRFRRTAERRKGRASVTNRSD